MVSLYIVISEARSVILQGLKKDYKWIEMQKYHPSLSALASNILLYF